MRFCPKIRSGLVLLAALLSAALVLAAPNAIRYEASHQAMGTVFTIVAYGRDQAYLSEVVTEAFENIDQLDAQMSNYPPGTWQSPATAQSSFPGLLGKSREI